MKRLLLLALAPAFFGWNAHAWKEGTLTCQFEVMSKKTFPKMEKLPPFSFDMTKQFSEAFQASSLENRLIIAYYPGFARPGDVNLFVLNMKYNGANAGADVPAVGGGTYTFKISRDDSDLIGAFLNCRADLR
ncbi:MAG: hypothetical protein HUU37_02300 [Bdellovibrionales bacterium]|nr:hypothetical protein [Bdellovibrionales bacterium]